MIISDDRSLTVCRPSASRHARVRRRRHALLVIFGASGDLTKRKLIPALYNLRRGKLLPDDSPSSASADRR